MSISTIFVFVFAGILVVAISLYEKQVTAIRNLLRKSNHESSLNATKVQLLEKELGEHKKIHEINEQIIDQYKLRLNLTEMAAAEKLEKQRAAKRKYAAKKRAEKKGGKA